MGSSVVREKAKMPVSSLLFSVNCERTKLDYQKVGTVYQLCKLVDLGWDRELVMSQIMVTAGYDEETKTCKFIIPRIGFDAEDGIILGGDNITYESEMDDCKCNEENSGENPEEKQYGCYCGAKQQNAQVIKKFYNHFKQVDDDYEYTIFTIQETEESPPMFNTFFDTINYVKKGNVHDDPVHDSFRECV
jgi:hypothetical protein